MNWKSKCNYEKRKENNLVKPDTVKKWKSIIHACLEYAVEKTISERLGHADIQTTLNIYADVLKELDEQSAEKIDSL